VTRVFPVVLWLSLSLALSFLVLPLVALFVRITPADLLAALGSPEARAALRVSLVTSLTAHLFVLAIGTPAAYLLATRPFRGRALAIAFVELPLILPPAVAGIGLLAAFGRQGLLGEELAAFGVSLPFTQAAVVMAVVFVASPFYLRQAVAAFEAVDRELIDAARTLGASPAGTFARVALPLASGGLLAGSALAWARGLGEFGATIMFAGSLGGVTETLPLAIYSELDRNFDAAIAIGALLVCASAAVLLTAKLLPRWIRSSPTSPLHSATSI